MSAHAQQTAGAYAVITNSFVIGVTVTNGGSGCGWSPRVAVVGGGGSGAVGYWFGLSFLDNSRGFVYEQ